LPCSGGGHFAGAGAQGDANGVVEEHRAHDQAEVGGIPPTIEEKGCSDEPRHGDPMAPLGPDQMEAQQGDGQKDKNEDVAVEKHVAVSRRRLSIANVR